MNHQSVEQTEKRWISNTCGSWRIFLQHTTATNREIHQPIEGRPECTTKLNGFPHDPLVGFVEFRAVPTCVNLATWYLTGNPTPSRGLWHLFEHLPLDGYHNYGKSQFLIGKSTINGYFP